MADFVKPKEKNTPYSVNRTKGLFLRLSKDEKDLFDKLSIILNERRNVGSQSDVFMYLVNAEFTRQDKIKIINENGV